MEFFVVPDARLFPERGPKRHKVGSPEFILEFRVKEQRFSPYYNGSAVVTIPRGPYLRYVPESNRV